MTILAFINLFELFLLRQNDCTTYIKKLVHYLIHVRFSSLTYTKSTRNICLNVAWQVSDTFADTFGSQQQAFGRILVGLTFKYGSHILDRVQVMTLRTPFRKSCFIDSTTRFQQFRWWFEVMLKNYEAVFFLHYSFHLVQSIRFNLEQNSIRAWWWQHHVQCS